MVLMHGSPYTDLTRPPLHEPALRRALIVPDGLWTDLRVVAETDSTNADVAAAARARTPEGLVVIAESQIAGRGRLERRWHTPARAGLTLSVLLRPVPTVPAARLGWLPLLAGVALVEAVGRIGVVDAALKWPNDLLVRSAAESDGEAAEEGAAEGGAAAHGIAGYGKCAGVLAEAVNGGEHPAVVLGIGLNVNQHADELPDLVDPSAFPATSLAIVGAVCTDRDPLLRGLLRALAGWYARWCGAGGDPDVSGLREAYRSHCVTVGQNVAVSLPGGEVVSGLASDVDADGRLLVAAAEGSRALAAGDVQHVR